MAIIVGTYIPVLLDPIICHAGQSEYYSAAFDTDHE